MSRISEHVLSVLTWFQKFEKFEKIKSLTSFELTLICGVSPKQKGPYKSLPLFKDKVDIGDKQVE